MVKSWLLLVSCPMACMNSIIVTVFYSSHPDGLELAAGQLSHGGSLIFSCKYGYHTRAGSR